MQTRQKVEQVKVYFSAVKHPHNPLHKAMKTQGDANWDRASFGWVKQRTQYCKYASWQNSSKPRSGKPIPASLRDTPARKLGKALWRMASRQNRVRDQASHSRKQQTTRPHSVHCWLSHQRPVKVGLYCQATIHEDSVCDILGYFGQ